MLQIRFSSKCATAAILVHEVALGSQTGGYVPKIIVMVDDKQSNLEDAKKILTANYTNIRFIGIKYQGAFEYAPCDISEVDFTKFWETLADQAKLLCLA